MKRLADCRRGWNLPISYGGTELESNFRLLEKIKSTEASLVWGETERNSWTWRVRDSGSQAFHSGAFDRRQWTQTETQEIPFKHNTFFVLFLFFLLWGWLSAYPERLWSLHSGTSSNQYPKSWATSYSWPCPEQSFGLGDLQRFLATSLWFAEYHKYVLKMSISFFMFSFLCAVLHPVMVWKHQLDQLLCFLQRSVCLL